MRGYDAEAFGARLRRKRLEYGLLQKDLAKRVGLSVSFYGHIERGTRVPSLPTLVLICNELHIGCDQLLRDSLEAPCLPRTCGGWTNQELGIFRQYMEERSLAPEDWFSPEEEAPAEDAPAGDQPPVDTPW